jgi:2-C-methyl-D-erythritol 2,4-cyclodiphosphate synthase
MHRIGIGYDIHRLVEGRKLVLGGVEIPYEKGLLGHSDGDALFHAIADALLGAVAHGDIGQHFPDTDPKFKDADSASLLERVVKMVAEMGYRVVNCDANIIAEQPKMTPHIRKMREKAAGILGVEFNHVSFKARSNEGLDAIGRGEAVAVQAAVLIESLRPQQSNPMGLKRSPGASQ